MRRKRHVVGKTILLLLAVLILTGVLCRNQIMRAVEKKASNVVVEKVLQEAIAADDDISGDVTAKEIMDSMEEEDKETVENIISEHLTEENINAAKEYVKANDMSGLAQYAKDTLDSDDMQTVYGLYEKYKNQIDVGDVQ